MDWTYVAAQSFCRLRDLIVFCGIPPSDDLLFEPQFPLLVPVRLAKKMDPTLDDPLVRQFVPRKEELCLVRGFTQDPLSEKKFRCCGRIVHKYAGRALLLVTKACGAHCRFCFRRHEPTFDGDRSFLRELDWLKKHDEISELILSGGDPLTLPTAALAKLFQGLDGIAHIKRLRIHTRLPIGVPERIDQELLDCLAAVNKQVLFVLHVNHARELDADVVDAIRSVQKLAIPVLSQTVLLRGVNDSEEAFIQLLSSLANGGIIPYYLHQLDRVQGAAHFGVDVALGKRLIQKATEQLSGYMVPKYVQERAGDFAKRPL